MACQTSSHTKNSCNGYEWKIVSLYEDVIDQMKYLFSSFNALYLVLVEKDSNISQTQHVDVRNKLFEIRECFCLDIELSLRLSCVFMLK